jgi:hypothetical protein
VLPDFHKILRVVLLKIAGDGGEVSRPFEYRWHVK